MPDDEYCLPVELRLYAPNQRTDVGVRNDRGTSEAGRDRQRSGLCAASFRRKYSSDRAKLTMTNEFSQRLGAFFAFLRKRWIVDRAELLLGVSYNDYSRGRRTVVQ